MSQGDDAIDVGIVRYEGKRMVFVVIDEGKMRLYDPAGARALAASLRAEFGDDDLTATLLDGFAANVEARPR